MKDTNKHEFHRKRSLWRNSLQLMNIWERFSHKYTWVTDLRGNTGEKCYSQSRFRNGLHELHPNMERWGKAFSKPFKMREYRAVQSKRRPYSCSLCQTQEFTQQVLQLWFQPKNLLSYVLFQRLRRICDSDCDVQTKPWTDNRFWQRGCSEISWTKHRPQTTFTQKTK